MKRFLLLAGIFLTGFVYAQDSLKTRQLDEVVVTGQYESQSIKKSVYQVRTISSERIKAKGATSLLDVLNTELNFRFDQDLALGGSSLTMNGLSGQYVKVLIDGVPMVGKSGTGNEINLSQININTIERIEVVDGPMSVAYGADAMAGVINIITRKAYEDKLSVSARVQEETAGNEYGSDRGNHNQQVAASYRMNKFYSKLEAGRNYFGGWKGDSTGRELQWHRKTQLLGGGVLGWKNDYTNIYYRVDMLNETLYNPANFSNGTAFDQKYITNRAMHQLQADVRIAEKISYTGAFAFTDYYRKTQSTNVDEATGRETLSLGAGQQDKTMFTGVTARGTFHYRFSGRLSFQPGYDINVDGGSGGRLLAGTHSISDYAFFISAEYTVGIFSIRPGIRVIGNSQYQAPPVIPSVNTKFTLSDRADLRLSYGRGFRAPSLRELYFDFQDLNHNVVGNPNLEAELSHSLNGSFSYQVLRTAMTSLQSTASMFYNDVDNMISSVTDLNTGQSTSINIAQFKSKGVVVNNKLSYGNFDASLGFSYIARSNQYYEDDPANEEFTWAPELNSNLSYRVPKLGLTTNFYYKYSGPYSTYIPYNGEIVLGTVQSYSWGDFSIQKHLLKYIDLTLGIRNVFDLDQIVNSTPGTGGHSTSGPKPMGLGRSYFIALNFEFAK